MPAYSWFRTWEEPRCKTATRTARQLKRTPRRNLHVPRSRAVSRREDNGRRCLRLNSQHQRDQPPRLRRRRENDRLAQTGVAWRSPSWTGRFRGERPSPAGVTEEHLPGPETARFPGGRSQAWPCWRGCCRCCAARFHGRAFWFDSTAALRPRRCSTSWVHSRGSTTWWRWRATPCCYGTPSRRCWWRGRAASVASRPSISTWTPAMRRARGATRAGSHLDPGVAAGRGPRC